LTAGDEFTIVFTEVGGDSKSYIRKWSLGGGAQSILRQIEVDNFVKTYQGKKAGSGTMTAYWAHKDDSVTCNIHITVNE